MASCCLFEHQGRHSRRSKQALAKGLDGNIRAVKGIPVTCDRVYYVLLLVSDVLLFCSIDYHELCRQHTTGIAFGVPRNSILIVLNLFSLSCRMMPSIVRVQKGCARLIYIYIYALQLQLLRLRLRYFRRSLRAPMDPILPWISNYRS